MRYGVLPNLCGERKGEKGERICGGEIGIADPLYQRSRSAKRSEEQEG